jgi:hypothetical protein
MSRTITTEETKKLFEFCRNHFVNYYDVQIELVDHLASAIEELWKSDADLSFDEALKSTFKKFGIYGFSKIKSQKRKALKRKYNRLLWDYFTEFYRWPKVLMTFVLTFALFILFQMVENSMLIFYAYFSALFIFVVIYFFSWYRRFKVKTKKKFLLIDYLHGVLSTLLILIIQIPNLIFQLVLNVETGIVKIENTVILFSISFVMVACGILIYGQMIFIPQKIKQHFFETFPEFAV